MSNLSGLEQKDISRMGSGRPRIPKFVYLFIALIVVILILYVFVSDLFIKGDDLDVRERIKTTRLLELDDDRQIYSDWIGARLGYGTAETYDSIATLVFHSYTILPASDDMVGRLWFSLHRGFLRVVFLIGAWWKFWLLALIAASIWSMRSWKIYLGNDILGRQTNGRLFYSGIRGDLKKIAPNGAPDTLSPGLACPKYLTPAETKVSPLGKVLDKHGITNGTALHLSAIICAYKKWPAFVAPRNEESLLEQTYQNTDLISHAALVLDAALSLRETYIKYRDQIEELASDHSVQDINLPMAPRQYVEQLKLCFNNVLFAEWKIAITEISTNELAVIILANEAGKVMSYSDEGHRFYQTSNFPQLCARSILHSCPTFSDDFNYIERSTIRRSIIYGLRKSVYGPVKFTSDLTPQTRAARQWVELLMACPHNLEIVSQEVELYGLICKIHDLWLKAFTDHLMVAPKEHLKGIVSHGTVLYVPFNTVLEHFSRNVKQDMQKRLDFLVAAVSHRQQLTIAENSASGITKVPDYERIFTPLSSDQITKLSAEHNLDPALLANWSSLRDVLNYFSWLGRRVGDNTVPDSSVIHLAVKKEPDSMMSAEPLVSSCHSGMIALRATRLIERWGYNWNNKFEVAATVTAVDNNEEFEKFKRGESLDDIDIPAIEGM